MKKLITLIALTPAAALAHGAHAPVPDAVHGAGHSGINVGLAILAVAVVLGIAQRLRS